LGFLNTFAKKSINSKLALFSMGRDFNAILRMFSSKLMILVVGVRSDT
jgi:hypothetical protein